MHHSPVTTARQQIKYVLTCCLIKYVLIKHLSVLKIKHWEVSVRGWGEAGRGKNWGERNEVGQGEEKIGAREVGESATEAPTNILSPFQT